MWTANGCLNKQAVGLAGRTIDRTYITHTDLLRKVLVLQKLAYYSGCGKGRGREEIVFSAENTAGVQEVNSSILNRLNAIVT